MKLFGKKRHLHEAADLSVPEGRRRAEREMTLGDHGFLREHFQNLHPIGPKMWRSNQPNPAQIAEHVRRRGIRTILNLRGPSTRGYYLLEKEACRELGVALVDVQVRSRDTPSVETIQTLRALFKEIAYPALMHCKSGADRAGITASLYAHFELGQPVRQASQQLSKKYLHVREGKTGLLDAFFEAYLRDGEPDGLEFIDWVATRYDPAEVKRDFLASGSARLGIDRLLRRE
ncbi:MAG: sulfur transferase domain-containing protein [Pseudomonadota bacterium]